MSLQECLKKRIRNGGPIPFASFMEEALYGSDGYYRRETVPIGRQGDYVTGSSLSPLFAATTARLLARMDATLPGRAQYLEAGYGNGTHLAALAALRGAAGLSAWDRIRRPVPPEVVSIADLEEIAPGEIEGLIFSYELFDSMPVHRLVGRPGKPPGELWVALDQNGDLSWREDELSDRALVSLLGPKTSLAPGQVADLSPQWKPAYRQLARRLGRGMLVTCDYGFKRHRLLDPRVRLYGTLACYSTHRVHRNPFVLVGQQDLTAHLDFSALIEAGEEVGLTTAVLSRQALWLTACGLFEELQDAAPELREEAMALLDPQGMGEEICVLVQTRDLDASRLVDLEVLGAGSPRE